MPSKRRQFLAGAAGIGAMSTAGCLADLGVGGGTGVNVGIVYALGGLGDKSFNDMANRGVNQAAEEFDVSFNDAEPSGADEFATLQRKFAEETNPNYDLVCTIGFNQAEALEENAGTYSDQQFMIVDAVVEADNVASYVFDEHLGSFQVGHLAGLLTQEDFSTGGGDSTEASTNSDEATVGFVGGQENSLIKKFEAGFMQGAQYAGDVDVRRAYAGSWSDPAKGKEIALSMYDDGADVVYHAAGGTGTGVFGAAQERGRYAIGVDADQSESLPDNADVIVASMVKRVDTAVLTSIENVVNDEHKGGEVSALGLESGGVEAVYGAELGSEIPQEIKDAVEDSKQAIIDGDIEVATHPDDV